LKDDFMGRIKTTPIKKMGREILSESKDKFSLDFTKNKEGIRSQREIKSKKTLNLVAGFITNELKKEKREEKWMNARIEAKRPEKRSHQNRRY